MWKCAMWWRMFELMDLGQNTSEVGKFLAIGTFEWSRPSLASWPSPRPRRAVSTSPWRCSATLPKSPGNTSTAIRIWAIRPIICLLPVLNRFQLMISDRSSRISYWYVRTCVMPGRITSRSSWDWNMAACPASILWEQFTNSRWAQVPVMT